MALRMRQSLSQLEEAFAEQIYEDRDRRAVLLRATHLRTRKREVERNRRGGRVRFVLLVMALILTAVIVTIAMFRTLYLLLG
jgi:hypothetical protein